MKIVIVEPLGVSLKKLNEIKSHFENLGHELKFYTNRNETTKELIKRIGDAEILTISNISVGEDIIKACPNLKLINLAFTGVNHIDLACCKKNNIAVCNAAGYSTTSVAELAVGLAINLQRNIVEMDANTRDFDDRNNYLGTELKNKTVGIIGTGAIGLATAKLFNAFGCNIIAHSRREKPIDWIQYVSLNELMSESDIISLHIPANKETNKLIDESKLSLMKKSAVIINTARGQVVDNKVLSEMLMTKKIAGAAIDVYETEPPLPKEHPLLSAPNTILLPHIAYASVEAMYNRIEIVKTNIESFLNGSLNNKII